MKTLLSLFAVAILLCSCKKEEPVESVNPDLNPVALKIYVNDSTSASDFIRVR